MGCGGARFAEPFSIAAELECLLIEKAYRADDSLALAIVDAVPRDLIADSEALNHVEPSLFSFSKRCLKAPIHHAVVKLVPMAGDGDTRLELAPGSVFLRLHERHYSARGEGVAYSIIDIDDSFIQLEVVRTQ